ncbi:MAG: hypothetical protein IJS37_00915 [Bacilli bacterium]|nr:hypothetical protein [Bacilli bacterium]
MRKRRAIILVSTILLASCSAPSDSYFSAYDTSFHAHYYGNMYCDESGVPDGFINYREYFEYAKVFFYLNGTCKFIVSEKNASGLFVVTEEFGTYTCTSPYPGGWFAAKYETGRTATYRWEPNWHDAGSTPYELSETRRMTIQATGETVDIVFSYASDYISEM